MSESEIASQKHRSRGLRSVCLATAMACAFAALTAGCGAGASANQFRISDPTGGSTVQIGFGDIIRSSAVAVRNPNGPGGVLGLKFSDGGQAKFCELTRAVARRGADSHRVGDILIDIDGELFRVHIDYHYLPKGLCGSSGGSLVQTSMSNAQRLARFIRG